jgi:zinc finger and BTB domain-containing protein 41
MNQVRTRNNRTLRLNHKGPYTCDICGKISKSRDSMYRHMRYRHCTKPILFCDLCPKSLTIKKDLRQHMRKHFKFKALTCDVCSYATNRIDALERHKLTHERTECPICHNLVANLKDHMTQVHSKQKERESSVQDLRENDEKISFEKS